MSTETMADVDQDMIKVVDDLIERARHRSLAHLGDKIQREGMALVEVGDMATWESAWCAQVAIALHQLGRGDDAAMWTRAAAILDTMPRSDY